VDGDDLAEKVGKSLSCSKSKYRGALKIAAGELQLFNNSSHGRLLVSFIFARVLRKGQVFSILFASRPALMTYSSRRCLQLALFILTLASVVYKNYLTALTTPYYGPTRDSCHIVAGPQEIVY
jgi:hypothetical protein